MSASWSSLEQMFRATEAVEASAVLTRAGTVSEWDTRLERLSGWPATHAVGRPLAELLVALEPTELPDVKILSPGMSWSGLVGLIGSGTCSRLPLLGELRVLGREQGVRLSLRRLPTAVRGDDPQVPVPLGNDSREDAQRLAFVAEHFPGFIYTVDRDLVFTSSIGAGLELLNLKQNQVVGVKLTELWGTSDPSYEPLACHLRALAGMTQIYQDVCVGRSLEYRLRPLRDADGNVVGVLSVAFDVTEREQAKEQQAKLTAQLRHAQKMEAIGRLAGGVAHDFNNLLTCIMGNLTLAESLAGGESPRLSHYLAGASTAAESAATLTRQLLAFSRKQVIEPRAINLSALIARVEGMLERLIGESITLKTCFAPDLGYVLADPGQLEQVLVNLVVNARDAITGHGEILVETQNLDVAQPGSGYPNTLPLGQYVVLRVRDTGRGMSDLVRSKLFEPFFTTKEIGAGTGLGLATVYGAVEQNGGTISVDSKLGEGSTFSIYLPRLQAEPSFASEAPSMPASSQSRGGNESILLVEDEPLVLELAHCTLEQLGYQVVSCAGADEALRKCGECQQAFDLLVTDVVMPRMNGKELASRVRTLRPGIAVLFSSGYSEDIIARQGVLETGLHFIGKPYRPGELAAKVRSILDQRVRERGPVRRSSA
jgi:signal transduction histidine kinase/ActR/RegA family two-component response regulator